MRIVIDIDGTDVTARLEEAGADAAPPPELLRRARELGARSAGAAPAEPGAGRMAAERLLGSAVVETLKPAEAGAAPVEAAGGRQPSKGRRAPARRKKR